MCSVLGGGGVREIYSEVIIWIFLKKDYRIKLFLNKCFNDLDLDLISKQDLEKWVCFPSFVLFCYQLSLCW